MKRQISLAEYRTIDLIIMTGLMVLSQVVIQVAVSYWYADMTGYIVSPVATIVSLVMMRWGIWAVVPAAVGGLATSLLCHGTVEQVVIYSAGNLLSLLGFLFLKWIGKERVRTNVVLSLLFGLLIQLLLQLGRAMVAAMWGNDLLACWDFITTDAMSILFTLVVVWIIRRIEGLFEDQKHYLLRVQKEQSEKGGEQL